MKCTSCRDVDTGGGLTSGLSRRDFVKVCTAAAVYMGLDASLGADAVTGLRAFNMRGINLTIPHKVAVIQHLDELAPEAELMGAVNTVVVKEGKLIGNNTDGKGFLYSVREDAGMDPAGKRLVFLGAGIWHPESAALAQIRQAMIDDPAAWKRARDGKKFRAEYELAGESLKKAPRGVEKDHPLIDDLKRKDFLALHECRISDIHRPDFPQVVIKTLRTARPFMQYLCDALEVPF